MKIESAHTKSLLPIGCKADALGTGLSGLSSASRGAAEAGRAPALAKGKKKKKGGAIKRHGEFYLGLCCSPEPALGAEGWGAAAWVPQV